MIYMYVHLQMSSDAEAMIEVVDRWLAKLYPQKPRWKEVADVVEEIGHKLLACSLKQVYVTGKTKSSQRGLLSQTGVCNR